LKKNRRFLTALKKENETEKKQRTETAEKNKEKNKTVISGIFRIPQGMFPSLAGKEIPLSFVYSFLFFLVFGGF